MNEMSHKNFRTIYTNRDENFYGEFPARPVRRAFDQNQIKNIQMKETAD
jgi:hypothetical protein